MSKWTDVRSGAQYVSLSLLKIGPIYDEFETIRPSSYNGKPQLVGMLSKKRMNVTINTTSCRLLSAEWGDEYEDWIAKPIEIKIGKAMFGQSLVDCILISPAVDKRAKRKR